MDRSIETFSTCVFCAARLVPHSNFAPLLRTSIPSQRHSPMPTPIPPLLLPYVAPAPQGSLTLVTSVLDATSNWLLLRYVHAALDNHGSDETYDRGHVLGSSTGHELQKISRVIFVSVLRGFEQWREMGKKVVGAPLGIGIPQQILTCTLAYNSILLGLQTIHIGLSYGLV